MIASAKIVNLSGSNTTHCSGRAKSGAPLQCHPSNRELARARPKGCWSTPHYVSKIQTV